MKFLMNAVSSIFLAIFALVFFSLNAFADAAVAAVADPTWADNILKFIATPPAYIGGSLVVLEFIVRLFPTDKSVSLLIPVRYAVSSVAKILIFVSDSVLTPLINSANNSSSPIPPLYKE